jgi:hypothetical protein
MQQPAANEAADWNEDQRMGELAMEFQEQQGVPRGPDEHVKIRSHAGEESQYAGEPGVLGRREALGRCCTQHTLT